MAKSNVVGQLFDATLEGWKVNKPSYNAKGERVGLSTTVLALAFACDPDLTAHLTNLQRIDGKLQVLLDGRAYVGGLRGWKVNKAKYNAKGERVADPFVSAVLEFNTEPALSALLTKLQQADEDYEVNMEPMQRRLALDEALDEALDDVVEAVNDDGALGPGVTLKRG